MMDEEVITKMKAQLIHFGGCRDSATSAGYPEGGAFTMALCATWAHGAFQGNYRHFFKKAASLITTGQQAQYNEYGPVTDSFRNSRPFQI
jgi:hypothetical protein